MIIVRPARVRIARTGLDQQAPAQASSKSLTLKVPNADSGFAGRKTRDIGAKHGVRRG